MRLARAHVAHALKKKIYDIPNKKKPCKEFFFGVLFACFFVDFFFKCQAVVSCTKPLIRLWLCTGRRLSA